MLFPRVRARIQEVEEGEPTQERFFQPHFLQAPGDMVAHEGRLCRLDCKVGAGLMDVGPKSFEGWPSSFEEVPRQPPLVVVLHR